MNKEKLIGKLQMVYARDINALNELIGYYDGLKEVIEIVQQENQKYKEIVDKAIYHLDFFISDTNLSKYDTLKILMHTKKILKKVDKEVE